MEPGDDTIAHVSPRTAPELDGGQARPPNETDSAEKRQGSPEETSSHACISDNSSPREAANCGGDIDLKRERESADFKLALKLQRELRSGGLAERVKTERRERRTQKSVLESYAPRVGSGTLKETTIQRKEITTQRKKTKRHPLKAIKVNEQDLSKPAERVQQLNSSVGKVIIFADSDDSDSEVSVPLSTRKRKRQAVEEEAYPDSLPCRDYDTNQSQRGNAPSYDIASFSVEEYGQWKRNSSKAAVSTRGYTKWKDSYGILQKFYEEHGVRSIHRLEQFQGRRIGSWCYRQQRSRRLGELLPTREALLIKLNPKFFTENVENEKKTVTTNGSKSGSGKAMVYHFTQLSGTVNKRSDSKSRTRRRGMYEKLYQSVFHLLSPTCAFCNRCGLTVDVLQPHPLEWEDDDDTEEEVNLPTDSWPPLDQMPKSISGLARAVLSMSKPLSAPATDSHPGDKANFVVDPTADTTTAQEDRARCCSPQGQQYSVKGDDPSAHNSPLGYGKVCDPDGGDIRPFWQHTGLSDDHTFSHNQIEQGSLEEAMSCGNETPSRTSENMEEAKPSGEISQKDTGKSTPPLHPQKFTERGISEASEDLDRLLFDHLQRFCRTKEERTELQEMAKREAANAIIDNERRLYSRLDVTTPEQKQKLEKENLEVWLRKNGFGQYLANFSTCTDLNVNDLGTLDITSLCRIGVRSERHQLRFMELTAQARKELSADMDQYLSDLAKPLLANQVSSSSLRSRRRNRSSSENTAPPDLNQEIAHQDLCFVCPVCSATFPKTTANGRAVFQLHCEVVCQTPPKSK